MATRTRLNPEQRRNQLLDLGAELFANQPFEEVWIEKVAEAAGVSRGLLYHYFPNKRAFFSAMLRREAARMSELTRPDSSLPVREQLLAGIEAYLDYCAAHPMGVRSVYRGAASADPEVREIIESDLRIQEARILGALSPGAVHPLMRVAVRSWLQFLRAACHEWLVSRDVGRDELRDLCARVLVGVVTTLPDDARPPGAIELLG
jgi:AcrR family transcriptional regulator